MVIATSLVNTLCFYHNPEFSFNTRTTTATRFVSGALLFYLCAQNTLVIPHLYKPRALNTTCLIFHVLRMLYAVYTMCCKHHALCVLRIMSTTRAEHMNIVLTTCLSRGFIISG